MAAVDISLVEKAVSCLFWHFESLFTNFLNKILNWIFWTNFWMIFWLNEYFKFCFELNIELNHFWARFNVWLNNRNVSDRARSSGKSLESTAEILSVTPAGFFSALWHTVCWALSNSPQFTVHSAIAWTSHLYRDFPDFSHSRVFTLGTALLRPQTLNPAPAPASQQSLNS